MHDVVNTSALMTQPRKWISTDQAAAATDRSYSSDALCAIRIDEISQSRINIE